MRDAPGVKERFQVGTDTQPSTPSPEAKLESPASHSTPSAVPPIRVFRVAAGLSQAELAEAAGLTSKTVSNLERSATKPSRRTIRALAAALSAPAEAIFPQVGDG
jgi:DNA-binding XRE family transcriptional regulator